MLWWLPVAQRQPRCRLRGGYAQEALTRQPPHPLLLPGLLPTSRVTLDESLCLPGLESPLLAEREAQAQCGHMLGCHRQG